MQDWLKNTIPEGDECGNYTVRSGWAKDFLTLRIDNRHIGGCIGQHGHSGSIDMERTEEEEEEHRMNRQDDEEEGDATEPNVKTRKEVGDSIQFAIQVQCLLLIALYNFMLQYMKV